MATSYIKITKYITDIIAYMAGSYLLLLFSPQRTFEEGAAHSPDAAPRPDPPRPLSTLSSSSHPHVPEEVQGRDGVSPQLVECMDVVRGPVWL